MAAQLVEQIGPMLLTRFDQCLEDHVQDIFASRRPSSDRKTSSSMKTNRRPYWTFSAQHISAYNARELLNYADHLFAAGRVVEAGRIYDHTQHPLLCPGPMGTSCGQRNISGAVASPPSIWMCRRFTIRGPCGTRPQLKRSRRWQKYGKRGAVGSCCQILGKVLECHGYC